MAKEQTSIEVRATVAHTQPGTNHYRAAGERFSHIGKLYEHVELVKEKLEEAVDAVGDAVGEAKFDE